MKMRRWTISTSLFLACLLAACGTDATATSDGSKSTAPAQGTSASSTTTKDQIVLAIGGESTDGYDPTLGWGLYGSPLFQSTLLKRDPDLKPVNDLAESYKVSDDRLTWSVTIRKDAKFSDGTPLTAKDVAFTFNQAAKSGGKSQVTVLKEAVAKGDYAVDLILSQPQSTFVNRLISLGIVPSATYKADTYAKNPIGSGPYKLVKWDQGQQLIVEVNPFYYGTKPQIQRLVFLFGEEDTLYATLKAGKAQVGHVPEALAATPIEGYKLYDVKSVDNRGLLFPTEPDTGKKTDKGDPIGNNVTSDLAIRQAVNYVIDRKALVKGVLEGYGSPAFSAVSGLAWEQPNANIEDANVDQAKKILADGGWKAGSDGIMVKNGQRAAFTITHPAGDSTRQALALASAEMIKKLGIDVTVNGKSWDDIQKIMHANVIVFGWGNHDATEIYNLYYSKSATGSYANAGYYNNAQVDKQLDLAMGAPSQEEANVYWKNMQWDGKTGVTAKGDAVWSWLVNLDHTYFASTCLDIGKPQIEPHGHGWPITANIASWKWTCK